MSKASAILISIGLFFGHILAEETDESIRKGKFLGITGYLSGSSDGFRLVPFWKQWNALLQVNIEKNKHKHGVYVLPASALYYPPYDGYGFYVPPNLAGLGNGLISPHSIQMGYRPMPLLFDEYKLSTTTLAPLSPDLSDKPKFDLNRDEFVSPTDKSDQKVSVLNLNLRDDRKTHKRGIEPKNQTDDEVVATVMEITDANSIEATTITQTSQPVDETTTQALDLQTTITATPSPEVSETATQSAQITSATTPDISTSVSTVDSGFQPFLNFYYGGTPNENANFIYFTTMEPSKDLASPTENPNAANIASDRNEFGDFRPSIQYEYRNYRYDTDNHFVPIVGSKQVF